MKESFSFGDEVVLNNGIVYEVINKGFLAMLGIDDNTNYKVNVVKYNDSYRLSLKDNNSLVLLLVYSKKDCHLSLGECVISDSFSHNDVVSLSTLFIKNFIQGSYRLDENLRNKVIGDLNKTS